MSKESEHEMIAGWIDPLNAEGFNVKFEDFLGTCHDCGDTDRFVTGLLEGDKTSVFRCKDCWKLVE